MLSLLLSFQDLAIFIFVKIFLDIKHNVNVFKLRMHCLLTHFDPISQVETAASERERLLLVKISELQTRYVYKY